MLTKKLLQISMTVLMVFSYTQPSQAASDLQEAPLAGPVINVPGDANTDLQTALNQVPNNGTIEIQSGTYSSPTPAFSFNGQDRSFTIQAADGANVVLSGAGNHRIIELINSPLAHVVFKGITFANGYDASSSHGAGVTVSNSNVTFIDCIFENNRQAGYRYNLSAASVFVGDGSTANFFSTIFRNNTSEDGGSGIATRDSTINVHNSQFLNNTTTSTTYLGVPVGGGINIANSVARVTNSRFYGNNTFGHGSAIYIIGEWFKTGSDVIVANSSFENNHVVRTNSVFEPISGGGINVEDNTRLKVYHSRFINNSAWVGGGMSIYRAKVEIRDSVFIGNRATDPDPNSGFGGAISFNINDRPDASSLLIEDTLIQGKYPGYTTVAKYGGGLHAHNSVPSTRPPITLRRVILNDLDTTTTSTKPTLGAGIEIGDVNFLMEDSIVMNCDARGPLGGRGGGMIAFGNTNINILRSAFANNSADSIGASLETWGSTLNVANSSFFNNVLSPGVKEYASGSLGAGIFSSPDFGRNLSMNGTVANNLFQNNDGLATYDDDRATGSHNALVYNNNSFYETTFGDKIYRDSLTDVQSPAGLNSLVVSRSGSSTDKAPQNNNQLLANSSTINKLYAAPSMLLPVLAAGEYAQSSTGYLGYGWNGSSANLDGSSLSSQTGVQPTTTSGNHSMNVDGTNSTVQLPMGPAPAFNASMMSGNPYSTLSWEHTAGSFLGIYANQGLNLPNQSSGSVQVQSTNRIYSVYLVTKEGGFVKSFDTRTAKLLAQDKMTVLISLDQPNREASFPIQNIGGWTIDWTAETSTPDLIQITTSSGTITSVGAVPFNILPDQPGTYNAKMDIDGGPAGFAQVTIEIIVVETVENVFLPVVKR